MRKPTVDTITWVFTSFSLTFFMDDVLADDDLIMFIKKFMEPENSVKDLTNKVLNFYKKAKMDSEEHLQDCANQKPRYSLRFSIF